MTRHTSAKPDEATAPQSPVVRHLGLIKAMSVIMAILIVAALVVIVVTIYSRLTTMERTAGPVTTTLTLPEGARISGASLGDKGRMLLIVEHAGQQQLWTLDGAGRLQRKIEIDAAKP